MAQATAMGARRPAVDGLLATKLHVPRVDPGHVRRQRLIDQLDPTRGRLILVCAPAGFGKTALLADWSSRRGGDLGWLSLDAGDDDPVRFWRHVAAALEPARPGVADHVEALLGPASASVEATVAALINDLAVDPAEIVLILDDYDLIEDERVHASVVFLLEHAPPDLSIVIASRADPPLPLARFRAGGRLTEIRAADLRFTAAEATDLFRSSDAPVVPEGAARELTDRTEGWVAGLQLAALSLRERSDIEGFVAMFSGSHRYVLDYLTEEVLERQPPEVRTFLLETSLLDRLSGPLCDAVTGGSDGQAMLEWIERRNLFLVPLDDIRGWWRYHHLFADLLRVRLRAERPERVNALHRGAAAWLDDHDLGDAAVRHALAAGDRSWAARLIERHADARLLLNEGATLQRWLAALPDEAVVARPRLLLAQANLALVSGDTDAFAVPFAAAERALATASGTLDEPFEPVGGRGASLLANIPASMALGRAHLAELRGDADATREHAGLAQELLRDGEWMLEILIRAHVAVSALLLGELDQAADGFRAALALCREVGERVVAGRSSELLGLALRAAGRVDAALDAYRDALHATDRQGRPPLPGAGRAHIGIAEVAYERNDIETVMRHLEAGIALTRQAGTTTGALQPLANALALLSKVRQAAGDPIGARKAMDEATAAAPSPSVTSLLNPVPSSHARLLLAEGHVAAAVRWAEERGLRIDDPPVFSDEPDQLAFARILIVDGRASDALGLLDRLAAAGSDRPGSMIEIQALRALALGASHEERAALEALSDAVVRAEAQGCVRVFVDEGPSMSDLLRRLAGEAPVGGSSSRPARRGAVATLLRAFDAPPVLPAPAQASATSSSPLVDPLTTRELEVLELLAAGRSNQEIAVELFVTIDTVKKHNTHILGKLQSANRTQAAARARELGLLG